MYWFPKKYQRLCYGAGIPYNLKHYLIAKIQLPLFIICFLFSSLKHVKKCDIIHAQFLLSGFVGVFLKKLTQKKLVITAHGSDIYTFPEKGLFKYLFLKSISHSDCLTTVSNENKHKLSELGLNKDMIKVIPNGISLSIFGNNLKSRKHDKNNIQIIWTGRMIEVKGLDYLLNSMKIITSRYPYSKLILVGDGPLKESLEKSVSKLSLNNNVMFVGSVENEDIPKHLKNADIFVMSSLSEGLPVSILEAMASFKPIISTNVGGIQDAVENGVNGFLVEPKDPEMLAEKLCYLIENPNEIKNMGLKSRHIVEKKFTLKIIAKKTIELYENFLTHGEADDKDVVN